MEITNEVMIVDERTLKDKIYVIRGQQVMLDFDLADTNEKIENYLNKEDFNSPYFLSLYQDNKVNPISINTNYRNVDNTNKIKNGLISLIENKGPYYIHCTEGKDRTGFIIIILEALADGGYEEIKEDYMITFNNYYGIDKNDSKYDVIVENLFEDLITVLKEDNPKDASLYECTYNYLLKIGMSKEQIDSLKSILIN